LTSVSANSSRGGALYSSFGVAAFPYFFVVRGTGVGAAVRFERSCSVLGPLLAVAFLMGAISSGGVIAYLILGGIVV
jgi:hypothetical protein